MTQSNPGFAQAIQDQFSCEGEHSLETDEYFLEVDECFLEASERIEDWLHKAYELEIYPEEPEMSHSCSRSWTSDQVREREKWHHASIRQRNFFPHSQYVPMGLSEWVKQREEMYEARIKRFNRATEHKAEVHKAENRISQEYPPIPPLRQAFDGQVFYGNHSAVLCQQTIWCTNWDAGFRFNAPWPGLKEMKWEGDDRAATKCGRFLPLPREPANPTVVFHHLRMLLPYPLDEVRRVPTLEDIVAPVEEIDDALIPDLIGTGFFNTIDNPGIYYSD